jgi:hypothetical protein
MLGMQIVPSHYGFYNIPNRVCDQHCWRIVHVRTLGLKIARVDIRHCWR